VPWDGDSDHSSEYLGKIDGAELRSNGELRKQLAKREHCIVNAVNEYESHSDHNSRTFPSKGASTWFLCEFAGALHDCPTGQARCAVFDLETRYFRTVFRLAICVLKNEQRGIFSMKRPIFALGAALLLSTLGPLPSVSAHDWWWHHHSNPGPAGVGANGKTTRTKTQRGSRSHSKLKALYNSPKSVGWWHKGPGPVGAGAGSGATQGTKTTRREKHQKEKSAQARSGHWYSAWLHRHHDSSPESAGAGGGSK
jgi:hypothetical protein